MNKPIPTPVLRSNSAVFGCRATSPRYTKFWTTAQWDKAIVEHQSLGGFLLVPMGSITDYTVFRLRPLEHLGKRVPVLSDKTGAVGAGMWMWSPV